MITNIDFSEGSKTPKNGFKTKYHATDGWRGYQDVIAPKGYNKIHETWATGEYEDAGENRGSEVKKRIDSLHKKYKNITVVTTPTSNVFSTGVDVYSNPEKKEKVKEMSWKMMQK